jgi:hypothetical protein
METMIIHLKNKQEVYKLQQISDTNGWQTFSLDQKMRWFIDSAPKDIPLTDDDIVNEVRNVRINQ